MMEIMRTARKRAVHPRAIVWHCKGCEVVHVSIDDVVFDLSAEEFRELASSVVETSYEMAAVNFVELTPEPSNNFLH
jgi:hypothetical protein